MHRIYGRKFVGLASSTNRGGAENRRDVGDFYPLRVLLTKWSAPLPPSDEGGGFYEIKTGEEKPMVRNKKESCAIYSLSLSHFL